VELIGLNITGGTSTGGVGAAISIFGGLVSLTQLSVYGNSGYANGLGSAIFIMSSGTVLLTQLDVYGNHPIGGGASDLFIMSANPNTTIIHCTFRGAEAYRSSSTIVISTPIQWTCALGYWMPKTGTFYGRVDGCLHGCPTGYYGDSHFLSAPSGANGCKACDLGHYCPSEATFSPSPCPPGTHMPATGAGSNTSCLPCAPGTSSASLGNADEQCAACAAGKFSSLAGQTACDDCPHGGYCNRTGAVSTRQVWTPCPPGTFGAEPGLSSKDQCSDCPLGTWCNTGSSFPCGKNLYTNASAPASSRTTLKACLTCPTGAMTVGEATRSIEGCLCSPKYLTSPHTSAGASDMCEPCPANASCAEPGTTLETLSIKDGYWRPGCNTTVGSIKRCPYADACANGTMPDATYNRSSAATCTPGRGLAGAYCQLCLDTSHYFSRGKCHTCDVVSTTASVLLPIALVAVIACAVWWTRSVTFWRHTLRLAPRSNIKIAISFYQIVSQLTAVYSIDYYPPEYERVLSAFRIFSLHLFAWLPGLHSTCLGLPSLLSQLLFAILVPILVMLIAVLVVVLRRAPLTAALPFLLYWTFLIYPSVSSRGFRALAPCDCFEYIGADTHRTCFLRTDYEELCYSEAISSAESSALVAAAWLAITLYALGVPLLYAVLLLGQRKALDKALGFLTKDYTPHARWWELVEVARKLLFTGFLALVDPGSLTQMYLAVTCSLLSLVLQLLVRPYRRASDNLLAMLSEMALAFTLLGTLGLNASRDSPEPIAASNIIVAILIVAALIVIVAAVLMLARDAAGAHARLLCTADGPISPPAVASDAFHLFLSHVWGTGQNQMRIVKQGLCEMLPEAKIFLDVDNLEDIDDLEGYIAHSHTVLVFCSRGYFVSKNCMRELTSAVRMDKPIVALLEPDAVHGGLSIEQVRTQLFEAEQRFREWGFGEGTPGGAALCDALFALSPIEWNCIGPFQRMTLRLIAEQLLPEAVRGTTFVRGELSRCPPPARLPATRCHVYCSPHNAGALELVHELEATLQLTLTSTGALDKLPECEHFLLLLDERTWTSAAAPALAAEVAQAMERGVPLLLCHEMPSALPEGVGARHATAFETFFAHTPPALLTRGIYSTIAITLKAGDWRTIGLVMLAQAAASGVNGTSAQLRFSAAGAHVKGACICAWAQLQRCASGLLARLAWRRAPLADADDKAQLEMHSARHSRSLVHVERPPLRV